MAQVTRDRLVSPYLAAGTTTLTVALACSGKTAWLDQFVARSPRPVVRVDCEPSDADGVRFGERLIRAASKAVPHLRAAGEQLLPADGRQLGAEFVESLAVDLARRPEGTLALDDLQLLAAPIQAELAELAERLMDAGWTVVGASRATPNWPIGRWRLERRLRMIDDETLAFTLQEARLLLPDGSDPKLVSELVQQSGGWAGVLVLTGADGVLDRPERLANTRRDLYEHLVEQSIARLPAEQQTFLLQTSVLNDLRPGLCDAVTARTGSAGVLEALSRRYPFIVPATNQPGAHRYHHLFAEALRTHAPTAGIDLDQARARAAHWCLENGDPVAATEYFIASQEWATVLDVVSSNAGYWYLEGRNEMTVGFIESVPRPLWDRDSTLMLLHYFASAAAGHHQEAWDTLVQLLNGPDQSRGVSAMVHGFQGYMGRWRRSPETALASCERALELLTDIEPSEVPVIVGAFGPSTWQLVFATAAARAEISLYRWPNARRRLVPVAGSDAGIAVRLQAAGSLAWLDALRGELSLAEREARSSLDEALALGLVSHHACGDAFMALAEIALQRGQFDDLERYAAEALQRHGITSCLNQLGEAQILMATADLLRGEPERVLERLADLTDVLSPRAAARADVMRAAALFRVGSLREAVEVIERTNPCPDTLIADAVYRWRRDEPAEPRGDPDGDTTLPRSVAIAVNLAEAIRNAGHDHPASAARLYRALELAEPEGIVIPFLAIPDSIVSAFGPSPRLDTIRAQGAAAATTAAVAEATDNIELTTREHAVLVALGRTGTMKEAAEALFISPNTMKSHTASVYRKLGVASRREALAAARHRGLT